VAIIVNTPVNKNVQLASDGRKQLTGAFANKEKPQAQIWLAAAASMRHLCAIYAPFLRTAMNGIEHPPQIIRRLPLA
jgi:hypothetical protein